MSIEPILPSEIANESGQSLFNGLQQASSKQLANLAGGAINSAVSAVVAAEVAVGAAQVAVAAASFAVAVAETAVEQFLIPHDFECSSHRFPSIDFRGERWDFAHLDPFAIRLNVGGAEPPIDVVVLFSNHCFTSSIPEGTQPAFDSIYHGHGEKRVLDPERYELSKAYLPKLIKALPSRKIQVAGQSPQNYFTFEVIDQNSLLRHYTVFFEVSRAPGKRRVILRVQSAYLIDQLSARLKAGGKVKLATLARAAYEGRRIKG